MNTITRHWLLLVALSFGVTALLAAARGRRAGVPEGLIPSETVRDFGLLEQGQKVSHSFELTNTSRIPVTIDQVFSGCGCTRLECSRKELAPGEKTTIAAEWSVGTARGRAGVVVTVVFTLVGVGQSYHQLELAAEVQPDIGYEPRQLEFDRNRRVQLLRLFPGRMKEYQVKSVSCDHLAFSAKLLDGGQEVEVAFDADKWPDLPPTYLTVETTSSNEPRCRVRLVVRDGGEDETK